MLKIIIQPPNIIPWLSKTQRDKQVILFDLQGDITEGQKLRLDINIVFNPIAISTGLVQRSDYYIGSTGAEVEIYTENGKILECTKEVALNVNYSNERTFKRNSTLNLQPEFKFKNGEQEADIKLGNIQYEANKEISFTAAFSSQERVLALTHSVDSVKWTITLPRGEKAIRDFLLGNLYLYSICHWNAFPKKGYIKIHPSDIRVFNDEKRSFSKRKTLFMLFALWKKGINFSNLDDIITSYEQRDE